MKRFSLRIPVKLHEKLRKESFETGKSINELIINAIEEYKGENKMLKEKYEVKFDEMVKENEWKYFIVGSPTNLKTVKVVKANTLKELWEDLYEMGEIDIERYESENETFDEEKEIYYIEEPENYKDAIEEYLKSSNNFYYNKMSWD